VNQVIEENVRATRRRWAAGAAIALLLGALSSVEAFGQPVGKAVGVEVGYGYITSSSENPQSASGLTAGLRYGYFILDEPGMYALLSVAAGYRFFPQGAGSGAQHAFVYGLEYLHTFFPRSPVALTVEYGLLFNLLLEDGRSGYAFGHHTRLGLGPDFRLGEKDELMLLVDYNVVSFPYFELSSGNLTYPSIAVRYQRRL
jgi:hypothetical protein